MTTLVTGVLVLLAAGAVLWFSMPKNGKPSVGVAVAPYIAVAITMGSLVGFGAMALGCVRMLSNG